MSNTLIESEAECATSVASSTYLAESLGSRILQLCPPELTLARLLDGEVSLTEDTLVFTPYGSRVDTTTLLIEREEHHV